MAASRVEVHPHRGLERRKLPRRPATPLAGPSVQIHWPPQTPLAVRGEIEGLWKRLPFRAGRKIRIRFLPDPRAWRNQLFSGGEKGQQVHAATYIRHREVVLAAELLGNPRELRRIFLHEIFHFAWVRAGNRIRREWESLIEKEWATGARGELGWSAEWRKKRLLEKGTGRRLWREYLCESFCDTAAWLFGRLGAHEEFTLAETYRARRAAWFRNLLAAAALPI